MVEIRDMDSSSISRSSSRDHHLFLRVCIRLLGGGDNGLPIGVIIGLILPPGIVIHVTGFDASDCARDRGHYW